MGRVGDGAIWMDGYRSMLRPIDNGDAAWIDSIIRIMIVVGEVN